MVGVNVEARGGVNSHGQINLQTEKMGVTTELVSGMGKWWGYLSTDKRINRQKEQTSEAQDGEVVGLHLHRQKDQ